jgi:hypothetical protein
MAAIPGFSLPPGLPSSEVTYAQIRQIFFEAFDFARSSIHRHEDRKRQVCVLMIRVPGELWLWRKLWLKNFPSLGEVARGKNLP